MTTPPYPNNLRKMREAAPSTRADLSRMCKRLAGAHPGEHTAVAEATLRDLEFGLCLPRPETVHTVCAVLAELSRTEVIWQDIFPAVFRATNNPDGKNGTEDMRKRTPKPPKPQMPRERILKPPNSPRIPKWMPPPEARKRSLIRALENNSNSER